MHAFIGSDFGCTTMELLLNPRCFDTHLHSMGSSCAKISAVRRSGLASTFATETASTSAASPGRPTTTPSHPKRWEWTRDRRLLVIDGTLSTLRCCCRAAAGVAVANLLRISFRQLLSLRPVLQAGPRGKKWRCMFICNVAVGRAYCTTELQIPPEQCPPPGYDSVVGEVSLFCREERLDGALLFRALFLWRVCEKRRWHVTLV